jgi:hypothetical protein
MKMSADSVSGYQLKVDETANAASKLPKRRSVNDGRQQ